MVGSRNIFEVRLGDVIELSPDHIIVVTAVDPGRWAHRLYIKENDKGLKVSHIVTVFNSDIMIMGGIIHLVGPDLGAIISVR